MSDEGTAKKLLEGKFDRIRGRERPDCGGWIQWRKKPGIT